MTTWGDDGLLRQKLDEILSPRLVSLDKSLPINIKWLLNLCNTYSDEIIDEEVLISYLKSEGYVQFSNETHKKVIKKDETTYIIEKIIEKPEVEIKKHRKPFNPYEFLNEIKNNTDLSIYTHKDNEYLIQEYRTNNNVEYLDRIIEVNIRLVQSIAKKFLGLGHMLEFEDLVQIGIIGLYKAVEKFDLDLGNTFSTYATWWIKQKLHQDIMNFGFTVRLPVHIHEKLSKLKKLQSQSIQNMRKIDSKMVADQMDISLKQYNELLKVDYYFHNLASLNTLVSPDGEETELIDLITPNTDLDFNMQLYHFEDPTQINIKQDLVEELLGSLIAKESDILRKRMGFYNSTQLTLEEIGLQYNVTRERIRQIEVKALKKLRKIIELKNWDKYDLMM